MRKSRVESTRRELRDRGNEPKITDDTGNCPYNYPHARPEAHARGAFWARTLMDETRVLAMEGVDDGSVVTMCSNGEVQYWLPEGQVKQAAQTVSGATFATFDPLGKTLVLGGSHATDQDRTGEQCWLAAVDALSGEVSARCVLSGEGDAVRWLPMESSLLLVDRRQGVLEVVDIVDGQVRHRASVFGGVSDATWHGGYYWAVTSDALLRWAFLGDRPNRVRLGGHCSVRSLLPDRAGARIFVGGDDGDIWAIDARSLRPLGRVGGGSALRTSEGAAISNDGHRIAVCGDHDVLVFSTKDLQRPALLGSARVNGRGVRCAFSGEGGLLVATANSLEYLDVADWR